MASRTILRPARSLPRCIPNQFSASSSQNPITASQSQKTHLITAPSTFTSRHFTTTPAKMASSSIPDKMSAIQVPKNGGADVLSYTTSAPVPSPPKENQILIKNSFAGVNFIDTYFRTGLYPTPPEKFPFIPGREGAGTIVSLHPSAEAAYPNLKVGDKVVYMSGPSSSYANYSSVAAEHVLPIPEGLAPEKAAACLLQGLTAWTFVREAGVVQAGEWTFVHAAAGGVGGLLVQMLSAVGAKVIAAAGSDEKCALAKAKGAGWVINSREKDVVEEAMKITEGKGVDVIFDGVGKATFDGDLQMAARKGRIVCFGNASGAVPPLDLLKLASKNLKVMRPVVNNYVTLREELEKYSGELFEMLVSGKVDVDVHKIYSLEDAAQAHNDLEGRKTTGKLLIKTD